jgi:coproporphyrinogen III oxidase
MLLADFLFATVRMLMHPVLPTTHLNIRKFHES